MNNKSFFITLFKNKNDYIIIYGFNLFMGYPLYFKLVVTYLEAGIPDNFSCFSVLIDDRFVTYTPGTICVAQSGYCLI